MTSASGLYRSDDGGGSWKSMGGRSTLVSGYFDRITVDPKIRTCSMS